VDLKRGTLTFQQTFLDATGRRALGIREACEGAVERAGIADLRFHDLRHTAACYLAMSGASLAEIAEVLGYKTLAMVKRYAHLSEGHTRSVVERMNRAVFGEP
jgi:site-specific recombinase XerD